MNLFPHHYEFTNSRGRRPGRTNARVVIERQPWHSI